MRKEKLTTRYITNTALLLSLALIFQIGFRSFAQPAVGPLVNLVLILSAVVVGTTSAVIIGCLTPLIAFMFGIMPQVILVPFIMLANSIFVIIFNIIRKKVSVGGEYVGLVMGSLLKCGVLALSVRFIITLFIPNLPAPLIASMSLPQLYTALIGGIIALAIIKIIPKNNKRNINL